jgi:hypothetical protein
MPGGISGALGAALGDLAATPRTAGPQRDGYDVRLRRFAPFAGFPALNGLAACAAQLASATLRLKQVPRA